MQSYTRIKDQSQIDALKNIKLREGVEYKYSLFLETTKRGIAHLLSKGKGILYIRSNLVDTGNLENVAGSDEWNELSYADFLKLLGVSAL